MLYFAYFCNEHFLPLLLWIQKIEYSEEMVVTGVFCKIISTVSIFQCFKAMLRYFAYQVQ